MRIALLRRPDGLHKLQIKRAKPFKAPEVGQGLDGVGDYVEKVVPLDFLESLGHDSDLERALHGVRAGVFAPQLLADLIELLRFTVADRESFPRGLAWPQLKPTPKDPMRTARHTRGYKG
ncbi:MAG: hypothetical protein GY930_13635, partial [bacterium]|nr:hypothetical protein [bacterium]